MRKYRIKRSIDEAAAVSEGAERSRKCAEKLAWRQCHQRRRKSNGGGIWPFSQLIGVAGVA
jgi:hypothetical protein